MALPIPDLDTLTFQQIVDHARRLIPRYCPEWTDHNVSDPGITLLELFASMAEMLIYRVNQVPDKMYITFLDLIGIRLEEARAATAPVTFYLSTNALEEPLPIPPGTEVATVRTETEPAIIFTTETDLTIRPPVLKADPAAYTVTSDGTWRRLPLRQRERLGEPSRIFPESLASGDTFCLALEGDHSHNLLALKLEVANAGGSGVNPKNPPIRWEVWHATAGFQPCEVAEDSTGGFNDNGEILLHLPAMSEQEVGPDRAPAFLLYCRLTEGQGDRNRRYQRAPELMRLRVEVRGGTARVRHAVAVRREILGRSDGSPGQRFRLRQTPLLKRDPNREYLTLELPDGMVERWVEVSDFADSGPEDRHYTLDSQDGLLTFGPLLPQPDGRAYCFGAVPAGDATLRFTQYRYGGGVLGNVPAGSIRVLKSSIPFIRRVVNRSQATGGRNAESLEAARLRAPQVLRNRTRAVTADDYEHLARTEVHGVAAARCLGPGALPGAPDDPTPGQIILVLLPQLADEERERSRREPIAAQQLALSDKLRAEGLKELGKRSLLGTELLIRSPRYVPVSVAVRLRMQGPSRPEQRERLKRQVEERLYTYLNPYTGGPSGAGWPFGRDLHAAELYGLLQQHIGGIEFVESLELTVVEPGGTVQVTPTRVALSADGMICSGVHQVSIA